MRFSFKKALASVLSVALVLSTFVGVLTTSVVAATAVGTLTMENVTAVVDAENKFEVVANIALDEAAEYVEVAYELDTLPEGVTLTGVATSVGTVVLDAGTGAIHVSAGADAVSAITVTMTFTAAVTTAPLEAFELKVATIDYADVTDTVDETITIDDTALITVTNHAPSTTFAYDEANYPGRCWNTCQVEGCVEHTYKRDGTLGMDWHKYNDEVVRESTCVAVGLSKKTCEYCGRSFQYEVEKLDHDYVYTDNEDGATHTKTCNVGGEVVTDEAHTYTEGVCVCGAIEVTECEHEYTEEITTAPTCEGAGVKTFTCTLCGDTYTEAIDATGHTEVVDEAVAATCTETGLTEGSHCSVCTAVIVAQEEVPALGHTEGTPVDNEDDATHTVPCSVCGETIITENHNYVDGTCGCGAVKETVTFNGTFRIKTVSLILGGEILIKYTMGTDSGSLNDPVIKEYGILAWNEDVYDPNDIDYDPEYAIPCETEDHTFKIAKYSFEMTDVVYTRAYAILTDGTIIYGIKSGENQAPVEYSVLKYATTQLNKTGSSAPDAVTRKLLIAMLNYGAAAQEEFKYKTDTLANASLTDAEKTIADATFDSNPQQGHIEDGKESVQDIANTRINGVSLVLSSAVLEKFYIKVSNETKAIKNVTLLTWLEEDYAKLTDGAVVGTETYSELCNLESDGRYSGKSMGLYAFELRDDVFVRGYIEYEDGTFGYTKLFQTSAEYYAKQQIGKASTTATTKKLLNAMMAYNDAAEAKFG